MPSTMPTMNHTQWYVHAMGETSSDVSANSQMLNPSSPTLNCTSSPDLCPSHDTCDEAYSRSPAGSAHSPRGYLATIIPVSTNVSSDETSALCRANPRPSGA